MKGKIFGCTCNNRCGESATSLTCSSMSISTWLWRTIQAPTYINQECVSGARHGIVARSLPQGAQVKVVIVEGIRDFAFCTCYNLKMNKKKMRVECNVVKCTRKIILGLIVDTYSLPAHLLITF